MGEPSMAAAPLVSVATALVAAVAVCWSLCGLVLPVVVITVVEESFSIVANK
jgi:hypothetical protein